MNTETNSEFDFSSKGGGQVASLESFLEEVPSIETKDETSPISTEKKEEVEIPNGEGKLDLDNLTDLGLKPKEDVETNEIITDNKKDSLNFEENEEIVYNKTTASLDYKGIIQKLVDEKVWEGIDAFETEEGEVPFEDMEIDEETFLQIYKQKEEDRKAKLLEDKVSTKKVSDFTKKLIEIEANGGNVQQALQSYNQYKSPLEGLDLSKESDQQAAIYLKYQAKGLEDADILGLITTYKQGGKLEEKALESKKEIETAFNAQMEQINQNAIEAKEKRAEELKNYGKTLGSALKDYELTDSYRKKLVDIATKENEQGSFELDNLYFQLRQNPEKSAELVMFLTNKEEYIKQITSNVDREGKLNTMRRIKLVPKGKSSVSIKNEKPKNNKNLLDLNTFK